LPKPDRHDNLDLGGCVFKRFLIFAFLGPPLGLLTGVCVMLPLLNWSQGGPVVFDYQQLELMPLAYAVGLFPALLAAAFDGVLARLRIGFRPLWCALFGFAVALIPMAGAKWIGFLHGPLDASLGFLGATPAGLCSWLSGKRAPRVRPSQAAS
jgi:hypothetical protein